jgi:MGT family glycosyltransferase
MMSTYLLCATPIYGNVAPLVAIAAHLVSTGHRVVFLTGSRFASAVEASGAEFVSLIGNADFDDRDPDSHLPDRLKYRGLARAQYDIQTIFVTPIPSQYHSVMGLIEAHAPDAILADAMFAGVGPLLESPDRTVPILAVGATPLAQSSADVAPMGTALPPSSTPLGRLRNRALNLVATRVLFRDTQRVGQRMFAEVGATLSSNIMDLSRAFDGFLQLTVPAFEYPRGDLSPELSFVGPVLPTPSGIPLPEWWGDLDGSRPVVHVTQGTIDNLDLSRLILPTIEALANENVLVVVTLGGRSADLGELPANVRVADFLPYDALLPLTDVYLTNGGYGGVQYALSHGVPLIVAGDTEDKPEVAARVAWSGTGIDLRTGSPRTARIAEAVRTILADGGYRDRARAIAADMAATDAVSAVEAALSRAVAGS